MADKALGPNEIDDEAFASAIFEDGGSLTIDLSNVEEAKFELIPVGPQDAIIDEFTYGKSKSSGQPMFTAVCQIDGGEYNGRKLTAYLSFSQKAIRGTKTNLMRIDPNVFAGQFNPQKIADDGIMLGKRVRIRIGQQDRQDDPSQKSNTVAGFLPLQGGAAEASGGQSDAFFKA
jgi:hypothetical protein